MQVSGLEGIVVAETRLSMVDGARGELVVCGARIGELAGKLGFEEAAARLWDLAADAAGELRARLGAARVEAFGVLSRDPSGFASADGMTAVRAAVARLDAPNGAGDPAQVTAWIGVAMALWIRLSSGLAPIAPEPEAGHAADLLRMSTGRSDAQLARALETYLVTVMDHGMNASTFVARTVASTGADLVSAVTAAAGALKGPLHGGAPGPVLDLLDAVAARGDAESLLGEELAAGRRIMGMGHRVYRVRDPRAAVLERAVRALADAPGSAERLALAGEVERTAERVLAEHKPDRRLRANVEFYTAVLLEAVGLPRGGFTACFAAGRVVGWCAHVAEQRATGRLIRPASRYVGPPPSMIAG